MPDEPQTETPTAASPPPVGKPASGSVEEAKAKVAAIVVQLDKIVDGLDPSDPPSYGHLSSRIRTAQVYLRYGVGGE